MNAGPSTGRVPGRADELLVDARRRVLELPRTSDGASSARTTRGRDEGLAAAAGLGVAPAGLGVTAGCTSAAAADGPCGCRARTQQEGGAKNDGTNTSEHLLASSLVQAPVSPLTGAGVRFLGRPRLELGCPHGRQILKSAVSANSTIIPRWRDVRLPNVIACRCQRAEEQRRGMRSSRDTRPRCRPR